MRIESTHSTNSTVHVVTLSEIASDPRSIGVDETTSVRSVNFNVRDGNGGMMTESGHGLFYNAHLLVADITKGGVTRKRASISSGSGPVEIPKRGVCIIRVDDCYSADINDKRRYVGDGEGAFSLVEEAGAE